MTLPRAAVLVALSLFGTTAACSKTETAPPDAGAPDAAADVPTPTDAQASSCDLDAPFSKGVLVDYRPTADAGAIPLAGVLRIDAKDERFGAFEAQQGPALKIFLASPSAGSFIGADERVASASVVHGSPALAPDGKTLYFSAVVSAKSAIYRATADAKDFGAAESWLTDAKDLKMPYVANAQTLYVLQGTDVARVAIDAAGKAGPLTPVQGVPAGANGVAVDAAETVLYYGTGSTFDAAVLHEMRKSGGGWVEKGTVTIDGLQKVETPSWLSPDGCRLYVLGWPSVVDRALYVASKPKK